MASERDRNRGMFGYEGEGFLRGEAGRSTWEREGGRNNYGGTGYGRGGDYGGFRPNDYGDFNRGDYATGNDRAISFRGRGPKGYQRSDERIQEDVCDRLTEDDRVDASDIEVSVTEATVILAGSVSDRESKRRAEDVAEAVSGVHDIQNQLRIGRDLTPSTSMKRTSRKKAR